MRVNYTSEFKEGLAKQVKYISLDKPYAARKFKNDIIKETKGIVKMPYSYRKSIFFDDDNIRDLIYKGYCIVFNIQETRVIVFSIVKYQNYR